MIMVLLMFYEWFERRLTHKLKVKQIKMVFKVATSCNINELWSKLRQIFSIKGSLDMDKVVKKPFPFLNLCKIIIFVTSQKNPAGAETFCSNIFPLQNLQMDPAKSWILFAGTSKGVKRIQLLLSMNIFDCANECASTFLWKCVEYLTLHKENRNNFPCHVDQISTSFLCLL